MLLLRKLTQLTNLGLRAATLGLRFCLSFYVIKLLGYEASGIYGLSLGLIGMMPALIGWGLNYFVSREVVGHAPATAMIFIRDRLVVTVISLSVATLIGAFIAPMLGFPISFLLVLIAILMWFETLTLDLHLPLLGLEMAFEANILVFIRTALWIVPVIILGLWLPETRSLEFVFVAWIIGHIVAAGMLVFFVRKWPLSRLGSVPVNVAWLRERITQSWLIYLSDLGLVGLIYIDRYIVGAMLGLTLTGVYTFYWSLTNALQTLVQTAIVQVALPVFVKSFQSGDILAWKAHLKREFVKTTVICVVLAVAIFGASEFIIEVLSMQDLRQHRLVFILLLLAAIVKSWSDLLNLALASQKRDAHYAAINIGGVFLSVFLAYAGISVLGLDGAGLAALLTAIILLLVRVLYLFSSKHSTPSGTAS